jgi:hypothetical protein
MSETTFRRSRIDTLFRAFTLAGSLICLGLAVALAVLSFRSQPASTSGQSLASLWGAISFALMFVISLPAVYHAWRDYRKAASLSNKPNPVWALALIMIPIGFCLASVSSLQAADSGPATSLGYAMVIGSVILAFVLMMRWMGPPLSPRRAWGHFLVGLWAMPSIALVMELILFIPSLLLLGLGLMLTPDGRTLIDMVTTLFTSDALLLTESIRALSLKPWVVGLIFFNLAFLVPLLEEAIKTMATWPLLRRQPSPAQGFLGGALAGAGFSLFEALFAAEPGQVWLAVAIGRTGTTLMHIFTAAITNWALVRASRDRKWGRFGLTYLGAVGLHGIWNASSVGMGLAGIILEADQTGTTAGYAMVAACAGSLILLCLAAFTSIALPWMSRILTHHEEPANA